MASRYNFSVQRKNKITGLNETYQVIECNSWEEAQKEVGKALHDQDLAEQAFFAKQNAENRSQQPESSIPSGVVAGNGGNANNSGK